VDQGGGQQFKFFSSVCMNYSKNLNDIWEIEISRWDMVHSFKDKAEEGAHHFSSLFQEPQGYLIQEILKVISNFGPIISERDELGP
jgi:hypothetical protein